MSILDSFIFVLRADSRQAVQGIEDVGEEFDETKKKGKKATEELENRFGEFGHKMDGIAGKIKDSLSGKLSGGFAALGASLGVATISALGFNEAIERIPELFQKVQDAATVGVDIESYDAMSRVFTAAGSDAEGFRDSMIDLNEAMGEASSDPASQKAKSFAQFGVSLKDATGAAKSADQVMLELSDSLSKMDKQQATFQIKQLGITDNKVIAVLLQGNKALKEQIDLQKQKFALTDKDKEQLVAYTHAQKMLQATIDGIIDQMAISLLPVLTSLTDGFRVGVEFIMKHKSAIAIAAGVIGSMLIPTIVRATIATGQWAVATLAATWPILAIGAAIAAFILVIDDLYSYYTGGSSIIGDFAEDHQMLKDVLEGLRTMAKGLMQFFSDMWNNPEKALQDFSDFMQTVWDNMVADTKSVFTELWNWLVNLFSSIGTNLKNSITDAIKEVPGGAKVLSLVGIETTEPSDQPVKTNSPGGRDMMVPGDDLDASVLPNVPGVQAAGAATGVVNGAAASPVISPSAGRNTTVSNTTSQRIDKVEVNVPSGNPQEVRSAVQDGLADHIKSTGQSWNDGVSH